MKYLTVIAIVIALAGCASKNPNDLQKSPCAGPCFEHAARTA